MDPRRTSERSKFTVDYIVVVISLSLNQLREGIVDVSTNGNRSPKIHGSSGYRDDISSGNIG